MRAPLPLLLTLAAALGCSGCVGPAPVVAPPREDKLPELGPRAALTDAIPPSADLAARFDGQALRKAPFVLGLLSLDPSLGALAGKVKEKCGLDPLTGVDELVVSFRFGAPLPLVVARSDAIPDRVLRCALDLAGPDAKRDGDTVEVSKDGATLTARDGIFVFGARADAKAALARLSPSAGPRWPLASKLAPPAEGAGKLAVLAGAAPTGVGLPIHELLAEVDATESRILLQLRGSTDSPAAAADLVRLVDGWLDAAPIALPPLLRGAIVVKRAGSDVVLELGVRGDARVQADFFGLTAPVVAFAARRYFAAAKVQEAKATVDLLAGLVRDFADAHRDGPRHTPVLPFSAPRVPAKVPAGKPVVLTAADWEAPSWKAVRFSRVGEQLYSYELLRSPDGRGVIVRATGDLDGNGVESRFERTVRATATGALEIGELGVTNEFE